MGEGRRTRSVGTKLTEEEYAKLEALAAQRGVTPGECVRELVLGAFAESRPEATPTEQALLSEVLALRTILINTVYDLASGEGMTPERMRILLRIDHPFSSETDHPFSPQSDQCSPVK